MLPVTETPSLYSQNIKKSDKLQAVISTDFVHIEHCYENNLDNTHNPIQILLLLHTFNGIF